MPVDGIQVLEEFDFDASMGKVEPFGGNNTRYVIVDPERLYKLVQEVCSREPEQDWVTVGVTPIRPLAIYPTEEHSSKCDYGYALAPGMFPEDYQELMEERGGE